MKKERKMLSSFTILLIIILALAVLSWVIPDVTNATLPNILLAPAFGFYDAKDVCSESPIEKVNINDADKDSLMQISGFGDAVSTQLITYRNDNGVFRRLEDIKKVNGIGNATFEKVKNYIYLHE